MNDEDVDLLPEIDEAPPSSKWLPFVGFALLLSIVGLWLYRCWDCDDCSVQEDTARLSPDVSGAAEARS